MENILSVFEGKNILVAIAIFLITAVIAQVFFSAVKSSESRRKKWPPSPPTLPLLGNLHQLNKGDNLLSALTEMARSYGPVMTVWMGPSPLVVLTGQAPIWEALVTQASNFAGRHKLYVGQFTTAGYRTTISSQYNEHWSKLRKILHNNVLSPFHIGGHSSSHRRYMNDLVDKLAKEMKANDGVVRPLHLFKITAVNFMVALCFGPGFQDENFVNKLEKLVTEDITSVGNMDLLLESLPFTRYCVPSSATTLKRWKAVRGRILNLLLPLVQFARSFNGYFKQSAPNCFLNCLLCIGDGEEEKGKQQLSDEEIVFNLFELFVLSVDSTSTAVEWALAYMIHHPDIQQRAYTETREAVSVSGDNTVCVEDLEKLPFLAAVVKETLRKEAIAPLAVVHETMEECKVMGITIPAKAGVIINLDSICTDPQLWNDPGNFLPSRFLGNVDSDKMRMSYLPFGAGRRICAGMDVAGVHIPITLANLLIKFEWFSAKEGSPPDLTPDLTMNLKSMKYPLQALIKCRSSSSM